MYLLIVSYTKPVEDVAPFVQAHSEWVKKYFNEGIFLFAGPKKNKFGGAILAKSIDRSLLNKIISEDSFIVGEVAEYQVIDFDCKVSAEGLDILTTV
jgi:uncharacterized protein YciI